MKELQLIIAKLKRADDLMEHLYAPLWEKYGITKDFIEHEMEK